jgi:hypothetical protein
MARKPAPPPLDTTVRVADDVLASAFEDEMVLLNLKDGVYYGLDGVGTRIWSLMARPVTVGAIRDAIVAEFEVEPARCEADLRALLASLLDRGLVVAATA